MLHDMTDVDQRKLILVGTIYLHILGVNRQMTFWAYEYDF